MARASLDMRAPIWTAEERSLEMEPEHLGTCIWRSRHGHPAPNAFREHDELRHGRDRLRDERGHP